VADEVANLAELGLSPADALRCATSTAAELLRLERSIGSLERGFEADLVAVEANPLEDARALRDPLLVVSNGRVALDRLQFAKAP
jgi:imidazolonepropionase-like amidohydrolase